MNSLQHNFPGLLKYILFPCDNGVFPFLVVLSSQESQSLSLNYQNLNSMRPLHPQEVHVTQKTVFRVICPCSYSTLTLHFNTFILQRRKTFYCKE